MKVNSISAVSYNKTPRHYQPMTQNFGAVPPSAQKLGSKMKALMLAGMVGMAAVNMSCGGGGGGAPAAVPSGTEVTAPTKPTTSPTTVDTSTVQNPIVQTPATKAVEDTGIYKALTKLGFDFSTEAVAPIAGQYQPKTGEIVNLSFKEVDSAVKANYNYTLDRENSSEGNLVYKGNLSTETKKQTSYITEGNTIVVNKDEKSVSIYDSLTNELRKFTLNPDGKTFTLFEDMGTSQGSCQVYVGQNKSLYGPRGEFLANINVKLAE